MDIVTMFSGAKIVTDMFTSLTKESGGADRYRASLAQENAKRADFLHLEREERARKEGILDAGLFRMRSELSGLSGVSADMWIGQRFMDVNKDINRERVSRQQTVNRFLKESRWHRDNADTADINKLLGVGSTALSGSMELYKLLQ
ncbi:MAG: hypothetical protein C4617_05880 [Candidatus Liberibacter europaeus]|uniref:Uncharacterized protein n=1 Tax=Candidatus Liberibacter europaeus TaxID=744859 RepID=A0A2T4VW91_9HYPH|nr:hypothetical protein [Candidatus Liberibacter europaeus]PTL86020.1 MAG: hypothetical protein C4617_05880 [Candidatus Liberibacter europaeus]